MSGFTWGTITGTSPLRVRVDGDTAALPITPDSLIDPLDLSVGDRVRCELARKRVVIHGRSGGVAPAPEPERTPAGNVEYTVRRTAPATWAMASGQALSRATYPDCFEACNPVIGTATLTIASPGVATLNAHGLYTGQMVYFTTTGSLPTGLSANVAYFVIRVSANTFRLATTLANAAGGTAINTSGSQSGTHTVRATYGVGNGSTTFNVPNIDGRVIVSSDLTQAEFDAMGEVGGAKTHTLTVAEMPGHDHAPSAGEFVATGGSTGWVGTSPGFRNVARTASTGGGGAHNNVQPYIVLNAIIKL